MTPFESTSESTSKLGKNSLQSVLSNLRGNREDVDLFDLSESLVRLCEKGLIDGNALESDITKLESSRKQPASPSKEDIVVHDVFSDSFLRAIAKQISVVSDRAVALVVTSKSGRIIKKANYGWRENVWNGECERDLAKLGREATKATAPLLSLHANKQFLAMLPAEALPQNPGESALELPAPAQSHNIPQNQPNASSVSNAIASSINLNQLSKALETPLLLLPVSLQESSGLALLIVDASPRAYASRDAFLADATEWWLGKAWLKTLTTQLDAWLLIQRSNRVMRVMRTIDWIRSYSYWWTVPIAALMVALVAPVPYYPRRECVFEPEQKQFIASPIQGRISVCNVRPGDTVEKDQLLARLDDDQLQRDLATAQAEFESAQKKRDSALATRATGNAGIADIEMTQAKLKIESLQDQLGRMEIRTKAAGVVVQGDWHRSIGMPVNLGQSLFEVAELESMTAEVRLSAADLGNIHVGDPVSIRSDASGGESFTGKIGRIEPRATVIEDEAVFIADVVIRDPLKKLRPGMKATAQVTASWKSLGWILFHRPYRWLANQWIW